MARRFDLLVFDWDGTLLDSAAAIAEAIQSACRDLDLPEPSDRQARQVIGLGLSEALHHCVPTLPDDDLPRLIERYRYHYLSGDHELALFEGASELVAGLHSTGVLLAVATGKSRNGLNRAMSHCGLGRYFAATRCADECFSKPHPQMLHELMAEFSLPAERLLMIGDTTHDLQMAINANVAAVAVAYGAHSADALDSLSPLARLHSIRELAEWLRENA
jgi:phosphoglycolate phosphatase